ncbi:MAG: protein kinase [Verrucomicrobiales bacterium]|nr:protein kinase [Verrucomicrobiales bacterium]
MTELFDTENLNPPIKTVSQADLDQYTPLTIEALNARLPQYEFLELIAVGGMGAVYKARQPKLDRLIAVKLLPKLGHDKYGFGDRFEQEAKAMAKLSHPHIVPIFDFGETEDGQAYFVMEFIEGADLFQLICGGQLTLSHFFSWIPQVCSAIQYAHKQDIVHRDIKPANILINKEGNVKMADFGLAKLTGAKPVADPNDPDAPVVDPTEDAISMGTPGYAAPEQFDSSSQVDARADIYALGVVMYQMLTGRMPQGAFPMPSECNPRIDVRLDEVVLRAMQEDADDRFQSIDEIAERLQVIHSSKNAPPKKETKKQSSSDPNLTPSGKRLITGPVKLRAKGRPMATGRVSTLTGKVTIPVKRIATAVGRPPSLVAGHVATLPAGLASSRASTKLRRNIDARKSSFPPHLIPLLIAIAALIFFIIFKATKDPAKPTQTTHSQVMSDVETSVKQDDKPQMESGSFEFISAIPTFNQVGKPLAVMRRNGQRITKPAGITAIPSDLKPIQDLAISAHYRKSSKPFALALHTDGTLTAWGDNSHGQLDIPEAAQSGVAQIAVGINHAMALSKQGEVIVWGNNSMNQTRVPSKLSGTISIRAGYFHSLALTRQGRVIPWGKGGTKKFPSRLAGNTHTVSSIAAGAVHSFALLNNGTLIGWGANGAGQLDEPEVTQAIAVQCSERASYALTKNGKVIGWGVGIRQDVAPNKKIVYIKAFPNALSMKNQQGQWLFYGAGQTKPTPVAPASDKMQYHISRHLIFAWPAPTSTPNAGSKLNARPSPNPKSDAGKKINQILNEAKKNHQNQFQKTFNVAIEKLNDFYSKALLNAKEATKNEQEQAAYQSEIERINSSSPIDDAGNSQLPEQLLTMRATYLKKLASYQQDLAKHRSTYRKNLATALDQLQQEFTLAKQADAAAEVKQFLQQRRQWLESHNPSP